MYGAMSFPGQEKMDDPALLSRLVYIYICASTGRKKMCHQQYDQVLDH